MRKVRIGFSTTSDKKLGAELIKMWISKPYSHVYVNWIDDQDRNVVWQASHGCVHTILKDNFILKNKIIKEHELEFTECEYQKMRDFCYFYSGTEYSTLSLVLIVVYDILKDIGVKPDLEDLEGFICSELVSSMLYEVKKVDLPKPSYLMRPDDVEKLLMENCELSL